MYSSCSGGVVSLSVKHQFIGGTNPREEVEELEGLKGEPYKIKNRSNAAYKLHELSEVALQGDYTEDSSVTLYYIHNDLGGRESVAVYVTHEYHNNDDTPPSLKQSVQFAKRKSRFDVVLKETDTHKVFAGIEGRYIEAVDDTHMSTKVRYGAYKNNRIDYVYEGKLLSSQTTEGPIGSSIMYFVDDCPKYEGLEPIEGGNEWQGTHWEFAWKQGSQLDVYTIEYKQKVESGE